ncbi:MAG: ABC transporter ATP-binding protein [Syntrophales bacterium]|nr:ABC transporter ATP-binding protein [Syntrophales bacterium]MDD4339332.1 ABC transporter ATP-binding protein [Syntrophales bacterium]HOG07399.1 ABC transporter ATP-binding protein [Syntrophales bacterium]HOS76553.1 ABC transporter ATP-binding protein [Syntrophales bacterium]HPB69479.1 ABC transporter ATP-binding protein [Syntrophales bacterium]
MTTEAPAPIIDVQGVSKSYRRGELVVPVLHDITFTIAPGEFLSLMGPSGSGKSTLLNLVAGIDHVDGGRIIVEGVDITRLTETELARWRANSVGFIFQFYNLIPVLTALENVELPLHLSGLSRRARREHALTALDLVGLSHRLDHFPGQLSGGEQQRVAIARAVVTDPTVLVADEPTGDLDRVSAGEVLDMMARLNRELGKTIVMVTHDPRAAARAHLKRHLDKGVLSADDPSENPD